MWFFKNYGILGQNARNLNYVGQYNNAYAKALADSKLKTKEFLSTKGVNVAETIMIIKKHSQVQELDLSIMPIPFVIKPNAGYGGKGILIIDKKDELGNFVTNNGDVYSNKQLLKHIDEILDGFYSLSGSRDKVIFERKIILDSSVDLLGKYGLPDIRVVVFNSIPIIAMLRVPTANSKGKANLHAGACGVGIDIGTGKLTYVTQFGKIVKSIPGIGNVRGTPLPGWNEVLKLAVMVQQTTQIGYVGCDIVLDDKLGPLLLEVNVRPGLEVQTANLAPMQERLKKVENLKVNSIEKGIRLGKDLFGGDIEEKIKNISGKKVLGNKEYVVLKYNDREFKYVTDIKISSDDNYISKDFLLNILKYPEEKIETQKFIKFKFNLLGENKTGKFYIKDTLDKSNIVLGKDILNGFLIDPFKYKEGDLPYDIKNPLLKEKNIVILESYKEQIFELDKKLYEIDKKLNILKIINPKNLEQERIKFIESKGEYIPKFEYNNINFDVNEYFEKLEEIEIPDIPLSSIFEEKKKEIENKLYFVNAFVKQNAKDMQKYCDLLYGTISEDNLSYVDEMLLSKPEDYISEEGLVFDEMKDFIKKFNHIYGININLVPRGFGARFSVKGNNLYVRNNVSIGKRELRAVIAHEIEGHYLRRYNGRKTGLKVLQNGTSKYIADEEGLAIYNQMRFLSKNDSKYYSVLERYKFIDSSLKMQIEELIKVHLDYYDNNYSKVFNYIVRLKRGLKDLSSNYTYSKDIVYLDGYLKVSSFIKNGGKINELYIGKAKIEDIELFKKSDFLNIDFDDIKYPFFI